MDRLYCVCGIANHAIYVANQDFVDCEPVPVTQSAITAVRDYMVDDIPKGKTSTGYSWKRGDGKTVKLICIIED